MKQVSITPCEQRADGLIGMNSPIEVETQFWVLKPGLNLHLTYHLVNEQEIIVLTTASRVERRGVGLFRACFTLPGDLLNSGGYTLKLLIVQNENSVIYDHPGLASFSVVDSAERLFGVSRARARCRAADVAVDRGADVTCRTGCYRQRERRRLSVKTI